MEKNQKFKKVSNFKFVSFINDSFNFIDFLVLFINLVIFFTFIFSKINFIYYLIVFLISFVFVFKYKKQRLINIFFIYFSSFFIKKNKKILVIEFSNFYKFNLNSKDLFEMLIKIKDQIEFDFIQINSKLNMFNYYNLDLSNYISSKKNLDKIYFVFYNCQNFNKIINLIEESKFKNFYSFVNKEVFNLFLKHNESKKLIKIDYFDTFENINLNKILKDHNSFIFIKETNELEMIKKFEKSILIDKLNNVDISPSEYNFENYKDKLNYLKLSFYVLIDKDKLNFFKNKNLEISKVINLKKLSKILLYKQDYNLYSTNDNFLNLFNYQNDSIINDSYYSDNYLTLGINQFNYLFNIDLFYKDNFNRLNSNYLILGTSGSGKSYLLKRIFDHFKDHEIPILILDLEGEYPNSQKINIYFILNIINLFKLNKEQTKLYLQKLFEIILIDSYKTNINNLINIYINNFIVDFEYWIKTNKIIIKNDYHFLFEKLDYQENILVLDFKDFFNFSKTNKNIEDLFIFLYINITNFYIDFNYNLNLKSAILIDEFHLLLNIDKKILFFLLELVKKIRKRNSALFISTQSLYDFYSKDNNLLITFINNINYFFIGKLFPEDLNLFKNNFYFSLNDLKKIESLNQGNFLFSIQFLYFDFISIF